MKIAVTSAPGAHEDGYGQFLAFSMDSEALGAFSTDGRIVDPRGLRASADRQLLYVNIDDVRIVAQDAVVAFEYHNGEYLGNVVKNPKLNGQAIDFSVTDLHAFAVPAAGRPLRQQQGDAQYG